jgi:tetratricopeptide (TPR) repeat protein/peroxiredoxin
MGRYRDPKNSFSRRRFLRGMRWAPVVFLPSPIRGLPEGLLPNGRVGERVPLAFADSRITPHYPAKSPLDDVLRLVLPGTDEFVTEKYAFEIQRLLEQWSEALKTNPPALSVLARFLHSSLQAISLAPISENVLRKGAIEVLRRRFAERAVPGRERFCDGVKTYFGAIKSLETAEFQIVGIKEIAGTPLTVAVKIRYDLVGVPAKGGREERIGHWLTQWSRSAGSWQAIRWEAGEETISRAANPVFVDISSEAFRNAQSCRAQMLHGTDYWRTVLDAACGIDVYGNNGLAVGDIDNDGFDDLYVCQPAGLPNRLYRNRGDGTFEDVAKNSGVDVLDSTACALFADFENKGVQDLLVVCGSGPLLFLNEGNGKFALKREAFRFAKLPQGTFTHAAIADYDGDGRLDIYFCLYSYYQGLDQYRYPVPYFDARNGPPNCLLHNEGSASFEDRTQAAGLNVDNDRYSFACAWGDYNGSGHPDLYVANDFGRSNLYRNNGDGTFTSVASQAGVDGVGAGMSAGWFDFNNDGRQDVYVANMWSAAGLRVSEQDGFHSNDPENIRELYRQHARGNSLYKNLGNGKFENVSPKAGVAMGRWAWCSDAWDFDHDGYSDLYIANGYISSAGGSRSEAVDAASFFWRQVVGKSPQNDSPSSSYEQGWSAINELIRSDIPWNGCERNVFYVNSHDGTFSDVAGTVGLDFADDSRAFVLADLDHDGRLEVILKNRTAPQLRVLRNVMRDIGHSLAFRLRGTRSNRDAIGARITVEAGELRQTKYLQAGSGFLSQHTKEVFFGVGIVPGTVRASVRWPSGFTQSFEQLPLNHRIEITEGNDQFRATAFAISAAFEAKGSQPQVQEPLPSSADTWLIEPMAAPEFSLTDLAGKIQKLRSFRGGYVLLHFWMTGSKSSSSQLRLLQKERSDLSSHDLAILGIHVDDPRESAAIPSLATKQGISFPILLATDEMIGVYNVIYRYLFDRRRDLGVPTSFLVDPNGMIVKVYQSEVKPEKLLADIKSVPKTSAERQRKALPFEGTLYAGSFQRNDFTFGVALFQRGYLEPAETSFKQVIAAKPNDPEAYYNLGTLYLRSNSLEKAREYLQQTLKLRPDYPEAWNNLGMISAQQGQDQEAIGNFQQALELKPGYATALLNLGNLYRRQGSLERAEEFLKRSLEAEPDNADVQYSIGMLYAKKDELDRAARHLERAIQLRPDYPDALNNLGVLLVRQQNFSQAKERFETCIRVAPKFDQAYLNLARVYVILNQKEKAKATLQALLQLEPDHKMARQALEMLN